MQFAVVKHHPTVKETSQRPRTQHSGSLFELPLTSFHYSIHNVYKGNGSHLEKKVLTTLLAFLTLRLQGMQGAQKKKKRLTR